MLKRILAKLEARTVTLLRPHLPPEEWCAHVYRGQLMMTKGSTVFMCGPCDEVVGRCFTPEMRVGSAE